MLRNCQLHSRSSIRSYIPYPRFISSVHCLLLRPPPPPCLHFSLNTGNDFILLRVFSGYRAHVCWARRSLSMRPLTVAIHTTPTRPRRHAHLAPYQPTIVATSRGRTISTWDGTTVEVAVPDVHRARRCAERRQGARDERHCGELLVPLPRPHKRVDGFKILALIITVCELHGRSFIISQGNTVKLTSFPASKCRSIRATTAQHLLCKNMQKIRMFPLWPTKDGVEVDQMSDTPM